MKPERKIASVSLDADNLWSYLRTHGDDRWRDRPSYLEVLGDRVIELFDDHDITPTVFVVGADAATPAGKDFIARLVERGIEIGNHSYEHEPWLHLYTPTQLRDELQRTSDAIQAAGAPAPRGFRGPGYSVSPDLVRALIEQGYDYDASVLATWIGPIARQYYLRTNQALPEDERKRRKALFGSFHDALLPNKGFTWTSRMSPEARRRETLTELPVSVFPMARVPMHASYAIYLQSYSEQLAKRYVQAAMHACSLTGTTPSLLLHPLDLLDKVDAPGLEFFPGMQLRSGAKRQMVDTLLESLKARYEIVSTAEHAHVAVAENRHRDAELLARGRSV